MKFLLEKGYKGKIFPVNPRYEEVGGVKCYPSIAEVPEPVDLAVVALPAKMVLDTIHQLAAAKCANAVVFRSEEHTSELQSLMRISYAVFCLKKKQTTFRS